VNNNRSGIVVDNFWKGPVILEECKFTYNKHSGVILTSNEFPSNLDFFKNGKDLVNGSIRKLNTSTKIAPANLFEESLAAKPQPSYKNPFKTR